MQASGATRREKAEARLNCLKVESKIAIPSLRGAQRRSNPSFRICGEMDCFARARNDGEAPYAAFARTSLQNSASRSASRNVAGLASGEATSATSVRSIGAKPSFAVKIR